MSTMSFIQEISEVRYNGNNITSTLLNKNLEIKDRNFYYNDKKLKISGHHSTQMMADFILNSVPYIEIVSLKIKKEKSSENSYYYNPYYDLKIEIKIKNIKNILDYLNHDYVLKTIFTNMEKEIRHNFLPYEKIETDIFDSKLDYKFKIKLFDYQKNNIELMKKVLDNDYEVESFQSKFNIGTEKRKKFVFYNRNKNEFTNKANLTKITTDGIILADEMGLGKTITTIAFLKSLPPHSSNALELQAKGNLIIVPSHLAKQWEQELNKLYTSPKVYKFLTKRDHVKITAKELLEYDYVIVTQSFLSSPKYYLSYPDMHFTDSSFRLHTKLSKFRKKGLLDKSKVKDILLLNPIFELIKWHNIVLDEGHEFMDRGYGSQVCNFRDVVYEIKSNYKLFISGTPYTSTYGYEQILKYMNVQIDEELFDSSKYKNLVYSKEFMNHIIIRHSKKQIEGQLKLKGLENKEYWLDQTDIEKQIYNGSLNRGRQYLLKLCCHLMVADFNSSIKIQTVDINTVKDNIVSMANSKITIYTNKLNALNTASQAFYALKKQYSDIISQNKFMLEAIKNFGKKKEDAKEEEEDEECAICIDEMSDPTILPCGHVFCYECITMMTASKKICPLCKKKIDGDMIKVKKEEKKEKKDSLIDKYGVKTGTLIKLVRRLTLENESENNNIIIFSQFDFMLKLVSDSLRENGVSNSFVKGNVFQRNKAIESFRGLRAGEKSKVIMLSLENKASGTHLVEANHIIFVDIMDMYHDKIKAIEQQAIARAYRIGQKRKVTIHRLITKNTVEETIYNKHYL